MSHYLLQSHSNMRLDFWEKNLNVPRLLLNGSGMFPVTKFQLIAWEVSRYNFRCEFFRVLPYIPQGLLLNKVLLGHELRKPFLVGKGESISNTGKNAIKFRM